MQFQFLGTPQKRGFGCACVLCLTWPEQFRQPEAWVPSPRVRRAFSLRGKRLRQPEAWASSPWCGRPFPSAVSGSGSQRLGRTLPGCSAPFPSVAAGRAAESGLRKSLDRNRWPVCSVGGGGFSGAEFAPFPFPLPPTSSGDGPALLWSFSVPFFCEPLAVCSGRLIFPCYPTV